MMHLLPKPIRKPCFRTRLSLNVDEWPSRDRLAWQEAVADWSAFDTRPRAGHLAESTKIVICQAYGRWLGFLERSERCALELAPGARLTLDRLKAFSIHLSETNTPASVANVLRMASQVLKIIDPLADLTILNRTVKRINQTYLRPSRRHRVRTSDQLHTLGFQLMRSADRAFEEIGRSCSTAAQFRDGLIIAIFSETAMRLGSLTSLCLDSMFFNGLDCVLHVRAENMKNRRSIDFQLSAELSMYLNRYIHNVRPLFRGSVKHNGLWASHMSQPLGKAAIHLAVCKRTLKHFGVRVSPHLFRNAAATLWSMHARDQIRGVSALLTHANFNMTETYNNADSIYAGREYANLIQERQSKSSRRPRRLRGTSRPFVQDKFDL